MRFSEMHLQPEWVAAVLRIRIQFDCTALGSRPPRYASISIVLPPGLRAH
jgi:hypothetical protein